jgi:antitoxin ParD1/3/4
MNISIGKRWEEFVEQVVEDGRFETPTDVVQEGLRLVAEREEKIRALRETIQASIAAGGHVTPEELDAYLDAKEAEHESEFEAEAAAKSAAR